MAEIWWSWSDFVREGLLKLINSNITSCPLGMVGTWTWSKFAVRPMKSRTPYLDNRVAHYRCRIFMGVLIFKFLLMVGLHILIYFIHFQNHSYLKNKKYRSLFFFFNLSPILSPSLNLVDYQISLYVFFLKKKLKFFNRLRD